MQVIVGEALRLSRAGADGGSGVQDAGDLAGDVVGVAVVLGGHRVEGVGLGRRGDRFQPSGRVVPGQSAFDLPARAVGAFGQPGGGRVGGGVDVGEPAAETGGHPLGEAEVGVGGGDRLRWEAAGGGHGVGRGGSGGVVGGGEGVGTGQQPLRGRDRQGGAGGTAHAVVAGHRVDVGVAAGIPGGGGQLALGDRVVRPFGELGPASGLAGPDGGGAAEVVVGVGDLLALAVGGPQQPSGRVVGLLGVACVGVVGGGAAAEQVVGEGADVAVRISLLDQLAVAVVLEGGGVEVGDGDGDRLPGGPVRVEGALDGAGSPADLPAVVQCSGGDGDGGVGSGGHVVGCAGPDASGAVGGVGRVVFDVEFGAELSALGGGDRDQQGRGQRGDGLPGGGLDARVTDRGDL